jgi:hypothetical protein
VCSDPSTTVDSHHLEFRSTTHLQAKGLSSLVLDLILDVILDVVLDVILDVLLDVILDRGGLDILGAWLVDLAAEGVTLKLVGSFVVDFVLGSRAVLGSVWSLRTCFPAALEGPSLCWLSEHIVIVGGVLLVWRSGCVARLREFGARIDVVMMREDGRES